MRTGARCAALIAEPVPGRDGWTCASLPPITRARLWPPRRLFQAVRRPTRLSERAALSRRGRVASLGGRRLECGADDGALLLQLRDQAGELLLGCPGHREAHAIGSRAFRALDDRGLVGTQ